MNSSPIGIFDSGVGGLTIWKAIQRLLPQENFIYFGDTARVPYGEKEAASIVRFSEEITHFLVQKNIKCLVIGCHTASACALFHLKKRFSLPIMGVIYPGIEFALSSSKTKQIAVLGTLRTIQSNVYQDYMKQRCPEGKIKGLACPPFVPLVEEAKRGEIKKESIVKNFLTPHFFQDIDTLLLACTHYPFLKPLICKSVGSHVQVIDPSQACALEAKKLLEDHSLLSGGLKGETTFYVTGKADHFKKRANQLLGLCLTKVTQIKKEPDVAKMGHLDLR